MSFSGQIMTREAPLPHGAIQLVGETQARAENRENENNKRMLKKSNETWSIYILDYSCARPGPNWRHHQIQPPRPAGRSCIRVQSYNKLPGIHFMTSSSLKNKKTDLQLSTVVFVCVCVSHSKAKCPSRMKRGFKGLFSVTFRLHLVCTCGCQSLRLYLHLQQLHLLRSRIMTVLTV